MNPFSVKQDDKYTAVPCGKCPHCLKKRASHWSFRLMQQDKVSESSYFLTLTYDTINVPISRSGFMEVSRRDLQLFFKRLRKSHARKSGANAGSIKYYAAAEYGGKTMRPHYHIILFNAKLELIQPAWNLGSVHYGTVTGASVGYTLKYMMKAPKIPMHRNDDRTREFSLMSKGLGVSYINDRIIRWHKADLENRMYVPLLDGKKASMPRYYKDRIYSRDERSEIGGMFKGKLEKELYEHLCQLSEPEIRLENHNKQQAVKSAYKAMYHQADKDRHKI